MNTHTIRLHRVLKAKPELVYKAFLDADALSRWLPPNGYLCKVLHLDAKVGGTFKMAFTQFSNGQTHSFMAALVALARVAWDCFSALYRADSLYALDCPAFCDWTCQ